MRVGESVRPGSRTARTRAMEVPIAASGARTSTQICGTCSDALRATVANESQLEAWIGPCAHSRTIPARLPMVACFQTGWRSRHQWSRDACALDVSRRAGCGLACRVRKECEAAAYSRIALFSGRSVPVVARFSIAGGDPTVPDADRSPRGMALEFRLPNGAMTRPSPGRRHPRTRCHLLSASRGSD